MDGKIAWLLWPRHELSPVSACFLLAAFHNSFILRSATRSYVSVCADALARRFLSPPPLSFCDVVWWTTIVAWSPRIYAGSVVVPIDLRASAFPTVASYTTRVGSQVNITGRGRRIIGELRNHKRCVYLAYYHLSILVTVPERAIKPDRLWKLYFQLHRSCESNL